MFVRALLTVATLGLATGPLVAQDSTQPSPAQSDSDKKICRQIVPTGTIMAKKFCLTKAEWRELDDRNGGARDAFRNKRAIGCGKIGGPVACEQ